MKEYIGDGVYAEFDGYGVELRTVRAHDSEHYIYLEPHVLWALNDFFAKAKQDAVIMREKES